MAMYSNCHWGKLGWGGWWGCTGTALIGTNKCGTFCKCKWIGWWNCVPFNELHTQSQTSVNTLYFNVFVKYREICGMWNGLREIGWPISKSTPCLIKTGTLSTWLWYHSRVTKAKITKKDLHCLEFINLQMFSMTNTTKYWIIKANFVWLHCWCRRITFPISFSCSCPSSLELLVDWSVSQMSLLKSWFITLDNLPVHHRAK